MSLMDRMSKSGTIKTASILSESILFNNKDMVTTDIPIFNAAFSGDLDGGLVSGVTILAGPSKSFKSLSCLIAVRAYLKKYNDAVCLFYDSEFGITLEYLEEQCIDANRVLHIPIENIEQLKFDIVKRLEEIDRKDHVIIFIDSIGNLASLKEVNDALDEKSVSDMTRAKQLKSLFRIITPQMTTKDIPCLCVAHTYLEQTMYPKAIVSGGTSLMYSASTVIIVGRQQEKEGTDVIGWNFIFNIEKSRFVREKSKFSFLVTYDGGIDKNSGLLDLSIEYGSLVKSGGWYQVCDKSTGELSEKKIRQSDITDDFWKTMLADPKFKDFVKSKYMLQSKAIQQQEGDENE